MTAASKVAGATIAGLTDGLAPVDARNLNADVIAIGFESSFIIAMYNKELTSSNILFAKDVGAASAPTFTWSSLVAKTYVTATTLVY